MVIAVASIRSVVNFSVLFLSFPFGVTVDIEAGMTIQSLLRRLL